MTHVRDVMAELRPPLLDEYGLETALRWYAAQVSGRTGLRIVVRADDGNQRHPADVEMALFRIAQEALTNTARHAKAREILITLASAEQGIRLSISDDGTGMAPETLRTSPGWGVTLMRERAESVGARCHLDSLPGEGTTVTVEWTGMP